MVEKAKRELLRIVLDASKAASRLPAGEKREVLEAVPVFMAEKMLEEANLTLLE
ncbi:hypothetical protein D1872_300300 [compost metagenome]